LILFSDNCHQARSQVLRFGGAKYTCNGGNIFVFINVYKTFFWTQLNLGNPKKVGVHCPRMPPVATGLMGIATRHNKIVQGRQSIEGTGGSSKSLLLKCWLSFVAVQQVQLVVLRVRGKVEITFFKICLQPAELH